MCKIEKVESIENYFKGLKEEERKHPILTKISRVYYRMIRFFEDIPLNIKTFIQRGKRGWANSDTWDFHSYLSEIICEGVKHLKKIQHGLFTWTPGKTELEAENEQDCILNTIINTFELAKEISNGDVLYLPSKEWSDKEYKKLKKWKEEHKYKNKILNKKEVEEFERGFDLFKEYFFSLWD